MPDKTTNEVLAEFKVVLGTTVENYDDPATRVQFEHGTADWIMNDDKTGMLIEGLSRYDILRLLTHAAIIISYEEERYYDDLAQETQEALDAIENDEDATDDEKVLACEFVDSEVTSQLKGFSHCVALIYGWANAAFAANESDTVDWDKMLEGTVE